MTEPIDPQPDGYERDRPALFGPDSVAEQAESPEAASHPAESPEAASHPAESQGAESQGAESQGHESRDIAGAPARDPADDSADDPAGDSMGDSADDPASDSTGDSVEDPAAADGEVAAALAELAAAADRPPADQVAPFTAAHETLRATLARIDDH